MTGGEAGDAARVPGAGEFVMDVVDGRVGVVIACMDDHVRLRPLDGGALWVAEPARVRGLSAREQLSARLAVANAARRWGKSPGP
jgi:hypothetical protein